MDALKQPFVLFALAMTILAALATGLDQGYDESPLQAALGDARHDVLIEGYIIDGPYPALRGWSLEVQTEVIDGGQWSDREGGRIRLFYPHDLYRDEEGTHPLPLPGDRIEVFARLERFPPDDFPGAGLRQMMENRGLDARGTAREPVAVTGHERGLYLDVLRRLTLRRLRFEYHLYHTLDADALGVAAAMLTASRGWMTPEFREPFDRTGTSHLLAISGLHLGVLGALLWFVVGLFINRSPWLLRRYGRRRASALFVLLTLTSYVVMIGAPTSARRALLMVTVTVVAYALMRSFCSIHALAAAALALIAIQPSIVFEVGFQLSFAATLGILLFWRGRPPWLKRPPLKDFDTRRDRFERRVGTFLGVSTSATLFTWPILWPLTGELTLSSVVLNWIVVPIVSTLVFPILVAGALLLEIIPPLGQGLLCLGAQSMVLMQGYLEIVAYSPFAGLRPGVPGFWLWLWTTLAVVLIVIRGFRGRSLIVGGLVLCVGLVPQAIEGLKEPERTLRVHFIPVGQGDATLIEFWEGSTVLIDGGGRSVGSDPGLTIVAPYLRQLGVRRLDWVILTHAHQDHMGGLEALARPFRPKHFVFDADEDSRQLGQLIEVMGEAGARLHGVDERFEVEVADIRLEILRPGGSLRGSTNDASLVTHFRHGPAGLLFPGDVEEESEGWLVARGLPRAALVKMPHHGSRTSSTAELLAVLQPAVAVASAGRHNHFGHPHLEVIKRYEALGARVWRTDLNGLVVVEVTEDGKILVRAARR